MLDLVAKMSTDTYMSSQSVKQTPSRVCGTAEDDLERNMVTTSPRSFSPDFLQSSVTVRAAV